MMCLCCQGRNGDEKSVINRMLRSKRCFNLGGFVVLLVLVVLIIYIGFTALRYGNNQKIVKGYDSYGNICDRDNERIDNIPLSGKTMKNDRILFFLNPYLPERSVRICVNTCPDRMLEVPNDVYKFTIETDSRLCVYNVPLESYHDDAKHSWFNRSGKGPCPSLPVEQSTILLNHCVPRSVPRVFITYLNSHFDSITVVLCDVYNSSPKLILIGVCAFGLSYALLLSLLLCCSTIKVFMFVVAFPLIGFVSCGFLWWMFASLAISDHKKSTQGLVSLDVHHYNKNTCLTLAVITTIALIAILSCIISQRKWFSRITLPFDEATKMLRSKPFLFSFGMPGAAAVLLAFWMVYWLFVLIYLYSVEETKVTNQGTVFYQRMHSTIILWWLHLVSFFPICNIIIACQKYLTADIINNIYDRKVKTNLCSSLFSLFSNLGSVVFGSIIISLATFPQIILLTSSKLIKLCAAMCPRVSHDGFGLDSCVICINDNAYTVMVVKGHSFYSSLQNAYSMVHRHPRVMTSLWKISDFVLFLVNLTAVATIVTVALICFMHEHDNLYLYSLIVLVVSIGTYYVSSSFIASYQVALHTLLWCYCDDNRTNSGMLDAPCRHKDFHSTLPSFVADGLSKEERLNGICASPEEDEAIAAV